MAGRVSWTPAETTRCQWATCLLPPGSAVLTQHRSLAEEPRRSRTLPGAPPPARQRCQGRLASPEAAQASHPHPSPACCPLPWPQGPAGGTPLSWVWAWPLVEGAGRQGTVVLGAPPSWGSQARASSVAPEAPDFTPLSFLGEAEGLPPTWIQCWCSARTPPSPICDVVSAVSGGTPEIGEPELCPVAGRGLTARGGSVSRKGLRGERD